MAKPNSEKKGKSLVGLTPETGLKPDLLLTFG
jgi:hypothetical protein